MLHVFDVFGFGTDFQKWFSLLNNGSTSSVNHGDGFPNLLMFHAGLDKVVLSLHLLSF
jgi:hypothetical protein